MAAISYNASGDYVFIAVEASTGGYQFVIMASAADLTTWTVALAPAGVGGSAGNVLAPLAAPGKMLLHGNFDTDAGLYLYDIEADSLTDISPGSLSAGEINVLAINPDGTGEAVIGVSGAAQALQYSGDSGATWSDWDAAPGFDATALAVLWSGAGDYHRYLIAGQVSGAVQLLYSPNEGASLLDVTGGLSVTNICNIEVV
jgi:hypothetical protein